MASLKYNAWLAWLVSCMTPLKCNVWLAWLWAYLNSLYKFSLMYYYKANRSNKNDLPDCSGT